MHGAVHDYVVLRTVKNGKDMPSAEATDAGPIHEYADYPFPELDEQPIFKKILDIGSLDICGSMQGYDFIGRGPKWTTIVGCKKFVGLDLIPGNGVTLVGNAHDIPTDSNNFDLVMCMNMLEHDSDPGKTMKEAYRVAKTGGVVIFTTVNETWGEHPELGGGDTETYNHITKKMFTDLIKAAGFTFPEIIEWRQNLFCYAKKYAGGGGGDGALLPETGRKTKAKRKKK